MTKKEKLVENIGKFSLDDIKAEWNKVSELSPKEKAQFVTSVQEELVSLEGKICSLEQTKIVGKEFYTQLFSLRDRREFLENKIKED